MSYRVRRQRAQRILITGIAGNLGRAVARRLHRAHDVFGLDRRPIYAMPKDIEIETVDLRRRRAEDLFRREHIDAVIHLNILHDPRSSDHDHHDFNLGGTKKLVDLCAAHNVSKLIVLSSANVYGPSPHNDQFLTEDAPLMAGQDFGAIRDLIALDMFCSTLFWRHSEIETVILRPVHIVGSVHNAPSRYLRMKRPVTMLGFDPLLQLIHLEDVVTSIENALIPGIRGVYNIAGPAPTPLSKILSQLKRTPRPIPTSIASTMLKLAWSLKVSDWPEPEINHLRFMCMVDDSPARQAMGFTHRHELEDILRDLQHHHPTISL